MLLATHTIIGTSLAQLLPPNPATAFLVGLAGHYLSDMIPHWNPKYGLVVTLVDGRKKHSWPSRRSAALGFALAGGEFALGGLISWLLYVQTGLVSWPVYGAAVIGSILPDVLQFFYLFWKNPILRHLKDWHDWWHVPEDKETTAPVWGATTQILIIILVVTLTSWLT